MDNDKNPFSAIVVGADLGSGNIETQSGAGVENVWNLVLNVGSDDGVAVGHKYVVFSLGPEIFDPSTKESLGHFEIVHGEGSVTHLQARMCTIRSANLKYERTPWNALIGVSGKLSAEPASDWIKVPQPFDIAYVGDYARRV